MILIKNITIASCLLIFSVTGALKQDLIDLESALNQLAPKLSPTLTIPVFVTIIDKLSPTLTPNLIELLNKNNQFFLFEPVRTIKEAKSLKDSKNILLLPTSASEDSDLLITELSNAGYVYIITADFRLTAPDQVDTYMRKFKEGDDRPFLWTDGKLLDTPNGIIFNKKHRDEIIEMINSNKSKLK